MVHFGLCFCVASRIVNAMLKRFSVQNLRHRTGKELKYFHHTFLLLLHANALDLLGLMCIIRSNGKEAKQISIFNENKQITFSGFMNQNWLELCHSFHFHFACLCLNYKNATENYLNRFFCRLSTKLALNFFFFFGK